MLGLVVVLILGVEDLILFRFEILGLVVLVVIFFLGYRVLNYVKGIGESKRRKRMKLLGNFNKLIKCLIKIYEINWVIREEVVFELRCMENGV